MAGNNTFLTIIGGIKTRVTAVLVGGAANANSIPQLNASGQLDPTMMPSGIGATTVAAVASAAISAGMLVNLYLANGVLTARPADNTTIGSEANAFATAAVASGATGTFTFSGLVTGLSGLTIGTIYFLGATGAVTATPPTTAGYNLQIVGKSVSTTSLDFTPDPSPVTLA